jgi:hypothetical protein
MPNLSNSEITLIRLDDALKRLLAGTPERTKADGKISIMRINEEAGLSRGNIYHYKEFITKAKVEIQLYNDNKKRSYIIDNQGDKKNKEEKLRFQRDKEKRLKVEYHEQAKNYKQLTDQLVRENASLAFRCMELSDELDRINSNIVPIKK